MSQEKRIKEFELLQSRLASGLYGPLKLEPATLVTPVDLKKTSPSLSPASKSSNYNASFASPSLPIISFEEAYTLDSLLSHPNSCALVFCSAKNPGGGVERGSVAQEESIALKSTWFNQVKDVKGFYLEKGASALNSDNLLYCEKSFILNSADGLKIEPYPVSFIGACAPNLSGMLKQGFKPRSAEIYTALSSRIELVLKLAEKKKHKHLILGAWGCGVFGLEPALVVKCFQEKIAQCHFSSSIVFAIPDRRVLDIFQTQFVNHNQKINVLPNSKIKKNTKTLKA